MKGSHIDHHTEESLEVLQADMLLDSSNLKEEIDSTRYYLYWVAISSNKPWQGLNNDFFRMRDNVVY